MCSKNNFEIYLNNEILTSESRFFYDLCIMAHEFYHLVLNEININIVKKVGSNSHKFHYGYYSNNMELLDITSSSLRYQVYVVNENEMLCEHFAYNFVIDLMEKTLQKTKVKDIDSFLLNANLTKMKELYNLKKLTFDKINNETITINKQETINAGSNS